MLVTVGFEPRIVTTQLQVAVDPSGFVRTGDHDPALIASMTKVPLAVVEEEAFEVVATTSG